MMTIYEKARILVLHKERKGYKSIAKIMDMSPERVKSYIKKVDDRNVCICSECGNTFFAPTGRRKKIFCSKSCKDKYLSKKHRDSVVFKVQCVCEECGKTFLKSKYSKSKFCSRFCFQIHESRKWAEIREKESCQYSISGGPGNPDFSFIHRGCANICRGVSKLVNGDRFHIKL